MMYEIGLRFVNKGHTVFVATSWRADRFNDVIDGIKITSFKVSGNAVTGMVGEITQYQEFLIKGEFDFLIVMAAQQWTLDAMLPVLNKIPYKKLHIPCGYSGFYLKKYKHYYKNMGDCLRQFDHLIYNARDYRDINFAKNANLQQLSVIPAGASELEFTDIAKGNIRAELGIKKDDFVYLSVGSPAYNKGHKEILKSYLMLEVPFNSVLVLNGNYDDLNEPLFKLGVAPKEALKELARRILGRSPYNILKLGKRNKNPKKNIIFLNLERKKLISLFFDADLFLFASHIEYSPLVIFECMAAGLPFLSIPVGNVRELVEWSGGGVICNSQVSSKGYSSVEPAVFAKEIEKLSLDKETRSALSKNGRQSWLEKFTWGIIANKIEELALGGNEVKNVKGLKRN